MTAAPIRPAQMPSPIESYEVLEQTPFASWWQHVDRATFLRCAGFRTRTTYTCPETGAVSHEYSNRREQ